MKSYLNISIVLILLNCQAFAKSGFEFGFEVPFGIGVGINSFSLTDKSVNESDFKNKVSQNSIKSYVGFDSGISLNFGYGFRINKDVNLSLNFETGYSHDTFAFVRDSSKNDSVNVKNLNSYKFESLILGIQAKFNWQKFSFGLAGGVKVPLYASVSDSVINYASQTITRNIEFINVKKIGKTFKVPVIPYLRISVDYSVYSKKEFNLTLGGYLGYDFGMSFKNTDFNDGALRKSVKRNVSSFDLGFRIGLKISPFK